MSRSAGLLVVLLVCIAGCGTPEDVGDDDAAAAAPAGPTPVIRVRGAYGRVSAGPYGEPLPAGLVVVFTGGLRAVDPVVVSDGTMRLQLLGEETVLSRHTVLPNGEWKHEELSRDKLGEYIELRHRDGETHVVLLPPAMDLLRKRCTISWGVPR